MVFYICRCSIFFANFTIKCREAHKLERRKRTKIFDYQKWHAAFHQNTDLTDNRSMLTGVQIGFGQRWNWGKSASGICIVAKVESMMAFNEMAQVCIHVTHISSPFL